MSGSSSTKAPASTNAGANPGDLPLEKEELIEKLKNGVNEEEEETNDRKKIDGQEEASLSRQVSGHTYTHIPVYERIYRQSRYGTTFVCL